MALDLQGLEAPFPVGELVQLALAGEGLEVLEGRRLAALERAGNLARRRRDAVLALVFPYEVQNFLLSFGEHRLSDDSLSGDSLSRTIQAKIGDEPERIFDTEDTRVRTWSSQSNSSVNSDRALRELCDKICSRGGSYCASVSLAPAAWMARATAGLGRMS